MALELPFGVKPVNPVPVEFWSGPYSGVLLQEAINTANSGIPVGVRFPSMEVNLIVNGEAEKYWYNSGIGDEFLTPAWNNDIAAVSGWADATITAGDNAVSGWADSTITIRDNAVSGWAASTFLSSVSGTPSGVAFFGDDELLTDDASLTFDPTNVGIILAKSSPFQTGIKMQTNGGEHGLHVESNVQAIRSYNRTKIYAGSSEVFDSRSSPGTEIAAAVPHFKRGLTAYTISAAYPAAVIKGASAQYANLTEWQNDAGDTIAHIGADGSVYTKSTLTGSGVNTSGIHFYPLVESGHPPYQEGCIFYDAENHCITVYNDESEISLQVGQEEYIRIRNNTGSTISNGKAVYITGAQGQHITVGLAAASGELESEAVGLATHDIENNSFGYVTTFGLVRGVDTTAFAEGDELFVAVSGGDLTNTSPIAPNYKTSIGHVVVEGVQGSILVTPRGNKLGGGDAKTLGDIQQSGIAFFDLITNDGDAGILASDPNFFYDSGNDRLHIGSGGVRFSDGTTQTSAASSPVGDPSGIAFFGDDGTLTSSGTSFIYDSGNNHIILERDGSSMEFRGSDGQKSVRIGDTDSDATQVGSLSVFVNDNTIGSFSANSAGPVIRTHIASDNLLFRNNFNTTVATFNGGNGDQELLIEPHTFTKIGQVIKGATSQTANLQEWQNSSEITLASVDSSGVYTNIVGSSGTDILRVKYGDERSDFDGSISTEVTGVWLDFEDGTEYTAGTVNAQSLVLGTWYNNTKTFTSRIKISATAFNFSAANSQKLDIQGTTAKFNTDVLPFTAMNRDLGSESLAWRNVYASGATVSGLYLANHTPANTMNTLYNVAGSLYFNGSEVGGAGGAGSNWTIDDGNGSSEVVPSGTRVVFSGVAPISTSYNPSNNVLSISSIRTYDNITSDFSMSDTSDVVFMDTTSGPINVYVPTAAGQGGKEIMVKLKAGSNSGVLIGSGAQTIDGQSQVAVYNTYESITLISDDSNWFIS